MVHSGCVVLFLRFMCFLYDKLNTLVKILGVVNTGRPLHVIYWGVATPAALTPMTGLHHNPLSGSINTVKM